MKQSTIDINYHEIFNNLATVEDLAALINFVHWSYNNADNQLLNHLASNEYFKSIQSFKFKQHSLSLKAFKFYTSPGIATRRYKTFNIKKKSGGLRAIHSPVSGLKSFQRALNTLLQEVFEAHNAANGFVPGRSIVDNAKLHVNQNYVFNIDLKDFFTSIDQARIWKRLQYPPFNLSKETGRLELANRIAALCCTEIEVERLNEQEEWVTVKRNVLPQGAPTSPTISNIIAYRLDYKLTGLANHFGLVYSRYADDITFSSKHNVYQKDGDFLKELYRIIREQNFHINSSKTRLQKRGFRQETTGLTVNEKVNVKQRYVKQLRMWLYYWEQYGFEKADEIFQRDYKHDRSHNGNSKPSFVNVLDGKLEYLKMVKGKDDPTYLVLKKRFVKLYAPKSNLVHIISLWESKGIEKAIEVFESLKS